MNSDLAPTIYDIALYDGSVRYMQRKKPKPNQLTKQFTVKNGSFWTVYAKLLTMYKSFCLHEMVLNIVFRKLIFFSLMLL